MKKSECSGNSHSNAKLDPLPPPPPKKPKTKNTNNNTHLSRTTILCIIFSMYAATVQPLNNSRQEPKKQFAVNYSEIPVILKWGQRHQTWYKLVDPKQGYNQAKFKKPHFNSVCEKANVFCPTQETCQLSPLSTCESKNKWYIHDLFCHPLFSDTVSCLPLWPSLCLLPIMRSPLLLWLETSRIPTWRPKYLSIAHFPMLLILSRILCLVKLDTFSQSLDLKPP